MKADANCLVRLDVASVHSGAVTMLKGIGKLACSGPTAKNRRIFETIRMGEASFKIGRKLTIRLHPVADGWKPVSLRLVAVVPQP